MYYVACNVVFSDCCLLLWPHAHERERGNYPIWFAGSLFVVSMVCSIAGCKVLMVFFELLVCVADCILRSVRKFSKVRTLFRSAEVWNNVEDYSHLVFELLLFLLSFLTVLTSFIHGGFSVVYRSLLSALLALFGIVIYEKRTTEKSYFLGPRKEKLIRSIARSNLRDPQNPDETTDNRRMNQLYKKAVEKMEDKKPYLDESFNLDDFARSLFTNKVYLSRTINVISGRNFRQFTNYYRVRYSVELIKKDPRLKVEEIALMSGFHTVVSYNMAFKLFMNETPSEWMHHYRSHL